MGFGIGTIRIRNRNRIPASRIFKVNQFGEEQSGVRVYGTQTLKRWNFVSRPSRERARDRRRHEVAALSGAMTELLTTLASSISRPVPEMGVPQKSAIDVPYTRTTSLQYDHGMPAAHGASVSRSAGCSREKQKACGLWSSFSFVFGFQHGRARTTPKAKPQTARAARKCAKERRTCPRQRDPGNCGCAALHGYKMIKPYSVLHLPPW